MHDDFELLQLCISKENESVSMVCSFKKCSQFALIWKKKKELKKKRQTLTTERGSFITDLSALLEN